ncbi:MAG: hypothetical protein R3E84_07285 [Pseudomonadales bacterium]
MSWLVSETPDPDRQADFASIAHRLNPARGLPALGLAVAAEGRFRTSGDPVAARQTLLAYRQAVETDPWNTMAWWRLHDFLEANPGLATGPVASPTPEAIVARVLELDPLFVPAIEARLRALAGGDDSGAARRFLLAHLAHRWLWFAYDNKEAALHYIDQLISTAPDTPERQSLAALRERMQSVRPSVLILSLHDHLDAVRA